MDKLLQTPPPPKNNNNKPSGEAENSTGSDQNTPPPSQNTREPQSPIRISAKDDTPQSQSPTTCISAKSGTPDRLKVPKAFKYPERYTSPTDQMMSPVTRGLLARSRKGSRLLPPSAIQPKIKSLQLQESSLRQTEKK